MTREEAIQTIDILLGTEKAAYKGLIPRENSLHITEIEALDMLLKEALQERPKGRWEQFMIFEHIKRCSECGCSVSGKPNFCPKCGADMRESE